MEGEREGGSEGRMERGKELTMADWKQISSTM